MVGVIMKKTNRIKSPVQQLSVALFFVGLVMLIESAATMFVLSNMQLASIAAAGWSYALLKLLVSLYAIVTGYKSMKK